ncbi:hypothetical protein [Phaffia rhodozyma]|uniref:Uncharacterized protein n=1 Tax=Phaffia rhodozyma TaxID=264483 RepID=A0A0F7SGH2_PHARH|nr:hypothetical protein [Phaffia rhodozyma]
MVLDGTLELVQPGRCGKLKWTVGRREWDQRSQWDEKRDFIIVLIFMFVLEISFIVNSKINFNFNSKINSNFNSKVSVVVVIILVALRPYIWTFPMLLSAHATSVAVQRVHAR